MYLCGCSQSATEPTAIMYSEIFSVDKGILVCLKAVGETKLEFSESEGIIR